MNPISKTYYHKKSTQTSPRSFRIKADLLFLVSTLSLCVTILIFLSHKPLAYKVLSVIALIVSSIALYRNHQATNRHNQSQTDHPHSLTPTPKPINLKALKQGLGS